MTDPTDQDLRLQVSQACRILFAQGQEHFFLGHVSARAPGSERIWIKPTGIGLGEVEPDDIVACNLDATRLTEGAPLHGESRIHTEIYRARPDVNSVVHTHPLHAAAFAAATAEFRIVSQDGVLFADGVGFYPHAPLVVTAEQGRELAESLGPLNIVVLKNHGIAAVGVSVPAAVVVALSFERSLRVQLLAGQFGPIVPLEDDEVRDLGPTVSLSNATRLDSMWSYLLRQAGLTTR